MISRRVAAMLAKDGIKHRNAERRAARFARILAGFATNPASVWHNLPVQVVEREKTRKVKAPNGGRQDIIPAPSRFDIYAGDILVKAVVS